MGPCAWSGCRSTWPVRTSPTGVRVDVWDGSGPWPGSLAEVELYVVPYMAGQVVLEPVASMPSLRVLQTLTAGYDDVLPRRPPGVVLCNAAGVHDASTAELAVTLTLAALSGVPAFVRAADAHTWETTRRRALADRRVLLVGYGGVGLRSSAGWPASRSTWCGSRRGPGRTRAARSMVSRSSRTCCRRRTS